MLFFLQSELSFVRNQLEESKLQQQELADSIEEKVTRCSIFGSLWTAVDVLVWMDFSVLPTEAYFNVTLSQQKRTIEKLKDKLDRETEKFNKERLVRETEVSCCCMYVP